jgi:RHH-type rel operon transcriptional repressor/antitoxin RelB
MISQAKGKQGVFVVAVVVVGLCVCGLRPPWQSRTHKEGHRGEGYAVACALINKLENDRRATLELQAILKEIKMQISVELKDLEFQKLEKLANLTGRTKTYHIIEALKKHLEEMQTICLAKQRLQDIEAGKTKTISHDKVATQYSL